MRSFTRAPPKLPRNIEERKRMKRLIVILEQCWLESAKIFPKTSDGTGIIAVDRSGRPARGKYELLNCDDHRVEIARKNADYADYRPDIVHHSLLTLLDSPLNRAGLLQVYVHTTSGVLIDVHPQTRIPRTFARFSAMMVRLLKTFKIQPLSSKRNLSLLRVIRNPVTLYLPLAAPRIATSVKATEPVSNLFEYVKQFQNTPVVFIVGGMSRGMLHVDYAERLVSVSPFPLSAACVCAKLCHAFETLWIPTSAPTPRSSSSSGGVEGEQEQEEK